MQSIQFSLKTAICSIGLGLFALASIDASAQAYPFMKNKKWGFLDKKGAPFISPRFEDIKFYYGFSEGLIPVKKNGKWGFANEKGVVVIKEKYNDAFPMFQGLAKVCGVKKNTEATASLEEVVAVSDCAVGYINDKGDLVVPTKYQDAALPNNDQASSEYIVLNQNGKYGAFNYKGQQMVPFNFSYLSPFSEMTAVASLPGSSSFGIIDEKGEWIIQPQYTMLSAFNNNMVALASKGEYHYLIDDRNKIVSDSFKGAPFPFGKQVLGLWVVSSDEFGGAYGAVNDKGKIIIPFEIKVFGEESDDLVQANKGGTSDNPLQPITGGWGFMNKKGKWVVQPEYEELGVFSEDLAPAKKGGKWGFINKKGVWAVNPVYDNKPMPFRKGLAMVIAGTADNPAYGYIDKKGNWVYEPTN